MESWLVMLGYVPVIGTDKSTVEAVAALCQGNIAKATEMGGKAVTGLDLDVATGGVRHIVGTTLAKTAAKGAVKVGAAEVGRLAANAATRAGAAEVDNIRKQRRTYKPDIDDDKEKQKGKKSKRGEHVINNNVLVLFKSIIDKFLAEHNSSMELVVQAGLPANSQVRIAYEQPMSLFDTNFIRSVAVAHPGDNDVYIDANSENYGRSVELLRASCVVYMTAILGHDKKSTCMACMEGILQEEVNRINSGNLYVDQAAFVMWHETARPRDLENYDVVKKHVYELFSVLPNNVDVNKWVENLRPYLQS